MSLESSSKKSIMTRNKSAQKKEESSRTAQMLQQLLMRPNITIKKTILLENYKSSATNVKIVAPPQPLVTTDTEMKEVKNRRKVTKKVDQTRSLLIAENPQYYPDKQKRNITMKKIVLRPKHDYKVIAATNKRKRTTPQRESSSPPAKLFDSAPEMSIAELVRMVEDQGMDDEDFMEILTCPSPVWWEEGSDEEETYIRFQGEPGEPGIVREDQTEAPSTVKELHETVHRQTSNGLNGRSLKSDVNYFNKVKKQSKLESVLGTMKLKTAKADVNDTNNVFEANIQDRNDSVGGNSDNSMNEEELLNTLENIEIPVAVNDLDENAAQADEIKNEINPETIKQSNKRKIETVEPNQQKIPVKRRRRRNTKKNFVPLKRKGRKRKTDKDNSIETKDVSEIDKDIVPVDLPPLTKSPFRNKSTKSPKSVDSNISETTNSSALEFDSISDTNIKFLDEYLDEKTDKNKIDKPNNSKTKKDDLVTVYKIVPNNKMDDVDVEDQIKVNLVNRSPVKINNSKNNTDRQINSFYRTRKRMYRRNDSIKQF